MSESDKDKRIAELEKAVTKLRSAMLAILRWDIDNVIPDGLFKRAWRAVDVADGQANTE